MNEPVNSGSGSGKGGASSNEALGGGAGDPLRDGINLCERFRAHYATLVEGFRSARQADRAARAKLVIDLIAFLEEATEMSRDQVPLLRAMAIDAMRAARAKEDSQPGRKRT